MSVAVVKVPFGTLTAVFDSLAHRGDTVSSLAHRACQAVATCYPNQRWGQLLKQVAA